MLYSNLIIVKKKKKKKKGKKKKEKEKEKYPQEHWAPTQENLPTALLHFGQYKRPSWYWRSDSLMISAWASESAATDVASEFLICGAIHGCSSMKTQVHSGAATLWRLLWNTAAFFIWPYLLFAPGFFGRLCFTIAKSVNKIHRHFLHRYSALGTFWGAAASLFVRVCFCSSGFCSEAFESAGLSVAIPWSLL